MVRQAGGCTVTARELEKNKKEYYITEYGAISGGDPVQNTECINKAIETAADGGGGTVIIPEGEFKTYTIRLRSNVNLYLSKGAVIRAARCDISTPLYTQKGEGGNYDEPEVRLYAGLQDHGHTYFANSLVYGENLENVMICGDGLFIGSYQDENGYTSYALQGGDPVENEYRNQPGHTGYWFGNKGIALVRCKNVVLKDFSIVNAGHFAIICEGVENMLVDSILADTIRDAFDADCCRDVTVIHSRFNSLTDDALVLKASFGAGSIMPLYNVYIEDCDVTGYDAGSVYEGKYTCDKLVATDRCGPTARVKLGTEASCGFELVTIKNVRFKRSRGFALEAVDTSDIRDVVFTECTMENVSSSPVYIRAGDRGRFPVTGNSHMEYTSGRDNVRLDNTNWILPDTKDYQLFPARRYIPSYNYTKRVTVDGHSFFNIVDEDNPVRCNPANYHEKAGRYYEYKYNGQLHCYEPDYTKEIPKDRLCLYANAVGQGKMAAVENIEISHIRIKDVDPRYPIIIMGLDSSHVKNVSIRDIDVEYRGGLTMEHAVEQRQLNTNWEYSQLGSKPSIQLLPWLANNFFARNEALLPRMSWNPDNQCFVPAPYNVPELPGVYPEPSNWGILPAYGLYARHVDGLMLEDVRLHYIVPEGRPAVVFDDVHESEVRECDLLTEDGIPQIVMVKNNCKRPTNLEYVPDWPYHATDNSVKLIPGADRDNYPVEEVLVDAPAPGTPRDTLYGYPTAAVWKTAQTTGLHGAQNNATVSCCNSDDIDAEQFDFTEPEESYTYEVPTEEYELPATVFRPYFVQVGDIYASAGRLVCFDVLVRNPLTDGTDVQYDTAVWNEGHAGREFTVSSGSGTILLYAENLPEGADFDILTGNFIWTPEKEGEYDITFTADDGVIPIHMNVHIVVGKE